MPTMEDEFMPRSAAASRLRKGKKKPEEMDDLGLPPEDEMPVDDAGGAPPDLAALLGAGGAEAGMPPPEGAAGMEGPPMEGGGTDLEMALAGVDAALQGMAPEQAEEIRSHMNAIREIAAGAGVSEQPPMGPEGAPAPDAGMEKPGQGVIPL